MTKLPNVVVGLTGNAASGKDTIAAIFEEHGFHHQSTSDLVREEISRRGLATSRELQTEVANELRQKGGGEYFVVAALTRARLVAPNSHIILSGIYAPAEGQYIIDKLQGAVVAIVGENNDSIEARFARIQARADSSRDQIGFAELQAAHQRENSGQHPDEANIAVLRQLARFVIVNDGNIDVTRHKVAEIVEEVLS